ncbi:hypothetical protein D4R30_00225, partial [archaeon]
KHDSVPAAEALLFVDWLDANGDLISQSADIFVSTGSWQRCVLTAQAPDGAEQAWCNFLGFVDVPTMTVLWSDPQFETNFETSPYAPGVTPFFQAADTQGPLDYSDPDVSTPFLDLKTISGLGFIGLRWNNPAAGSFIGAAADKDHDYIDGVFTIYRSADNGVEDPFTKLDEVPAFNDGGRNSYDDNTPDETEAATWYYRLKARDRFGNVGGWLNGPDYSVQATSKTLNDLLPAPVALRKPTVVAQDDGSIVISAWDDATPETGVTGYRIWRIGDGETPIVIGTVQVGTMSYVDTDTVDDETYQYAVTAYNQRGSESSLSPYSDPVTAHDHTAPGTPANLRITGGLGSMRLDWDPVPGALHYVVSYAKDGTDEDTFVTAGIVDGPSYTIFGLTEARTLLTSFTARIKARDGATPPNDSAFCAPVVISAASLAGYRPGDGVPPQDPPEWDVDFASMPSDGTILLRWVAPPDVDLAGFIVEQQESTAEYPDVESSRWEQLVVLSAPTQLQYRVVGLEPYKVRKTQYLFRVRSLDHSGQVSDGLVPTTPGGDPLWLRAVDTTGPADYEPLEFTAAGALGTIRLAWLNPSGMPDYFLSTFEIWRARNFAFTLDVKKLAEVAGDNDGTPNRYDDLEPADNVVTTYYYRLKPKDRFGNAGDYLKGGAELPYKTVVGKSKTTSEVLPDEKRPDLPAWTTTDEAVANADGTITLRWLEAATGNPSRRDLAGYNIWRKPRYLEDGTTLTENSAFERVGSVTAQYGHGAAGPMSWTELPPTLWTKWHYAITAFDNQLEESTPLPPDVVGFDTFREVEAVDTRPPEPPTNFVCLGTLGGVVLSWLPSVSPGVTQYEVVIPPFTGVISPGVNVLTTGTSYSVVLSLGPARSAISNNPPNPSFFPTVKAVRETGSSWTAAKSAPVNLSRLDLTGYIPVDSEPPKPPRHNHDVAKTAYGLTLGWDSSPSADVNRYIVEVLMTTGWYTIGTGVAGSTGCFIAGLQQQQQFFFRAAAIDNANNSSGTPENFRYYYVPGAWYYAGDAVLYMPYPGSPYESYVCKATTFGNPPTNETYWKASGYSYSQGITIPAIVIPNDPPVAVQITGSTSIVQPDNPDFAKITITWQTSPDLDFSRYQYRRNQNDASIRTLAYGQGQTSESFLYNEFNADYVFEVRVLDQGGLFGPWSVPYTVHTLNNPGPSAGPTVTVTHTTNQDSSGVRGATFHVEIDPTYVKPTGTHHYNVYVSKDEGLTSTTYSTSGTPSVWDHYEVASALGPVTFSFKVKCMDATGQISKSASGPWASDVCPQGTGTPPHTDSHTDSHADEPWSNWGDAYMDHSDWTDEPAELD